MSRLGAASMTLVLVGVCAIAACSEDVGAPRAGAPTSAAPAPEAAPSFPADLNGTWKVTLRRSELVVAPDDLRLKTSDWALEFHENGGKDDGPSMTVVNDDVGTVVNPIRVSDEELTLDIPTKCRTYSYAVDGDQLTFKPVESRCPRDSMSSVLTARTWQRTQ